MDTLFDQKPELAQAKNRFIKWWNRLERGGAPYLLRWLETTDFYTAPCSTRFHLAEEGGLLIHSLNVFDALSKECEDQGLAIPLDSLIICGLGHDLCKVNFYSQEMRNVKEDGKWVQKPFYTVKDQFPYGHGEKSALLVNKYIKLDPAEFMAIRWHMGGFTAGAQEYSMSQAMSAAFEQYPLALLLHIADMKSTYLTEKKDPTVQNQL